MTHDLDSRLASHARFPPTRWADVLAAGATDSPQTRQALESLCRAYWPPLYAFARRGGLSPCDAQDLVQGFFADLLQRDWSARLAPNSGRFRSFLLAALHHFRCNEWDKLKAQKRGSGVPAVPLDLAAAEDFVDTEPADSTSPAHAYDRTWALALVGRVFEQLRVDCQQASKAALFAELQNHLIAGEEPPDAPAIAARLGMSEDNVRQVRSRLRRRLRELLRDAVGATVRDPADIEDEVRYLIAVCAAEGSS